MVSYNGEVVSLDPNKGVLILIVMDNGLLLPDMLDIEFIK